MLEVDCLSATIVGNDGLWSLPTLRRLVEDAFYGQVVLVLSRKSARNCIGERATGESLEVGIIAMARLRSIVVGEAESSRVTSVEWLSRTTLQQQSLYYLH